jgi:PAS domain S-box-containing protein
MNEATPLALKAEEAAALFARSPFASAAALVVAGGAPPRAVFATPGLLALFGASDLDALDAVMFGAESPGARRVRQLAQSLPIGAAPRLERLRFYRAGHPIPIGLVCARVVSAEGREYFVAGSPEAAREEVPSSPGTPTPAPKADESAAASFSPTREAPLRYLWSLDAAGQFGPTDFALSAGLGTNAPRPGETFEVLAARLRLVPANAFAQAIALRRTFSALRFEWPDASGARALVVLISGAPLFDRDRNFGGFRGFGVFTGEVAPLSPAALETAGDAQAGLSADMREPAPDEILTALESQPEAPPRGGRDSGAEIVVLRPGAVIPQGAANVVPFWPNALSALNAAPEELERRDESDNVELTSQERDAFREIARALGARTRTSRVGEEADEPLLSSANEEGDDERAPTDTPSDRRAEHVASADRETPDLLDLIPIGAMVTRGGETVHANRTLLDLAGFTSLEDLRAAGGAERMFAGADPSAMAAEESGIALTAADGQAIRVSAQARAIAWEGAPATLISVRRSREAENQAQLHAAERKAAASMANARDFQAALDAAADGFIRLDALGRILAISGKTEALFGYEEKLAIGESFLILLAPAGQGEAAASLDRVVRAAPSASGLESSEFVARDREGRTFPIRLVIGPLPARENPEFFMLAFELSRAKAVEREQQAARAAAEKASVRKTEFLARVSHEIRTPLHAILGFAEVMIEERFGPIGNERYKDYVKDIHSSGQHVMSLANDLLDLSKIEAGKMDLEFAPIDANRIIRECVALMQPQAARERVIMRLSLFDKLPNLMADERSLRQIMLNLMSNAVKFNEPGGQVIVSTAVDEAGHALIRVRDTGVGMNESELDVALEPFRQVGGPRRDDGTGLGLPLSKALAEANHADFSIKSRKDHGTLVEVAFPSVRAAQ